MADDLVGIDIVTIEPYAQVVCPDCYAQRDLVVPMSSLFTPAGVVLMLPDGERLTKTDRDQKAGFCLVCGWYELKD